MPVEPHLPPARPFGAVCAAMVTPFTVDGKLDLEAAQQLAERLVAEGHDGLVVSGTTGESPTTSDSEKESLLAAVLDAVGTRARVVAGVGTNDTAHTVELARTAERVGAHGLLVVTPYYSKPPQEALRRHFLAAADATDLPVMLYDIPGRSGVPIATETLVRLAEHPRIVAVKDAKGDLYETSWVQARTDLAYYCGEDALNLAFLTHGAAGLVSVVSHVAGPEFAAMVRAVDGGDLGTALAIHRRLLPAVRGLMTRTQGVIAVKAALELTGALPTRTTRPPLLDATAEEVAALSADLDSAGLLEARTAAAPAATGGTA